MEVLQIGLGWIWLIAGGLLYAGQLISTVNFPLAQRLGLQERPDNVDPVIGQLERKAAGWDLIAIWTAPVAGLLMVWNDTLWPAASLVAGAIYLDAGGREWAKILGLRAHGVPVGSAKERAIIFGTFAFFIITGIAGIALGLAAWV